MSNRSGSKQHGCHMIKRMQPSSKARFKKAKAQARPRQEARQSALQAAISQVPALEI